MKHKTYLLINVIAFIGILIILLFTADFSKTKSTEESLRLLFTLSAISELIVVLIMLAMFVLKSIASAVTNVCRYIFWWLRKRKQIQNHCYEFCGIYALIPSSKPTLSDEEIMQFIKRMLFAAQSCISAEIAILILLNCNNLLDYILSAIMIVHANCIVFRVATANTNKEILS